MRDPVRHLVPSDNGAGREEEREGEGEREGHNSNSSALSDVETKLCEDVTQGPEGSGTRVVCAHTKTPT